MVLEIHIPNIPKQDRSLKRYESALQTADIILAQKGIHAVTLKEIAKLSGIKRSSLYKFFPSNLAILYALSKKHMSNLLNMLDANIVNTNFRDSSDFMTLVIDLLTIYLNEHKGSSIMLLSHDLPTKSDITLHSINLLSSEIINKMKKKEYTIIFLDGKRFKSPDILKDHMLVNILIFFLIIVSHIVKRNLDFYPL